MMGRRCACRIIRYWMLFAVEVSHVRVSPAWRTWHQCGIIERQRKILGLESGDHIPHEE